MNCFKVQIIWPGQMVPFQIWNGTVINVIVKKIFKIFSLSFLSYFLFYFFKFFLSTLSSFLSSLFLLSFSLSRPVSLFSITLSFLFFLSLILCSLEDLNTFISLLYYSHSLSASPRRLLRLATSAPNHHVSGLASPTLSSHAVGCLLVWCVRGFIGMGFEK